MSYRSLFKLLLRLSHDQPTKPVAEAAVVQASRVQLFQFKHPGYHRLIAAWHVEAASDLEAWARFLTRHNLDAPLTHNSHKGNW